MLDSLDGVFAILLMDERTGEYIVARDPMGICPMYWGTAADGSLWFASELKALHDICETFDIFPPVRTTLTSPPRRRPFTAVPALLPALPLQHVCERPQGAISHACTPLGLYGGQLRCV